MKSFKYAIAALAMAAAPMIESGAHAKVYALSISGTIIPDSDFLRMYNSSPIDKLGVFGAVNQDLSGQGFSLVYTINTSQPWAVNPGGPSDNSTNYSSGINPYYQRGSAITASLTVGGVTIFDIGKEDANATSGHGIESEQWLHLNTSGTVDSLQIYTYANSDGGSPYLFNGTEYPGQTSFAVTAQIANYGDTSKNLFEGIGSGLTPFSLYFPHDRSIGTFSQNYSQGYFNANGRGGAFYLYFDTQYASLQEVVPVPEPEEWAMMSVGLVVAGAVARRRKARR